MGKKSQVIALLILMFFVITSCINPIPIQAADTYTIPNGVDQDLQPALNSKIQANMDVILKRVDTDMNNLVEPLIPQISSMVAQKTSDMGGKINKIGIDTIQPSLKAHVEEQAQIIKNEVNNIVMNAVMQAGPQSDPSSLIRSALVSALPQLKQDTITRADQEQRKEMETVRPLIEAVIQEEMTALLPDIQNLVLAKLQEGVPATKRAVDADIDAMISELQSSLPDEQKKLMEQMRPQFEAKARPQISEELFDAVAVKIDQKVVSGIETVNKESIKAIVKPMNQYCTDFAANYAKSLLPPEVDQLGIRSQIEQMIEETAQIQVTVFEERIMADNDEIFKKQSAAINQQMHEFVKTKTMALLEEGKPNQAVPSPVNNTMQPVNNPNLQNSARVVINGQTLSFDVPPQVIEGRTVVPLRKIFEALGAAVKWDDATKTVTAQKGKVQISLQAGQKVATRNGEKIKLDVPATIIDSRTMVPVRFISESFGAAVNWDDNTRTVNIQSK